VHPGEHVLHDVLGRLLVADQEDGETDEVSVMLAEEGR
jgi:hypothetical protein